MGAGSRWWRLEGALSLGMALGILSSAPESVLAGDLDPKSCRYYRQVDTTDLDVPSVVRIALEPPILGACRPGLTDLRLLDERNREVPHAILVERPGESEETREASTIAMNREGPTGLRVILDVSGSELGHNELGLVFGDSIYACRARLTHGEDGRTWRPVPGGDERLLESLTSKPPVRLAYDMSRARYLRLQLDCEDEEELRSVTVRRLRTSPGRPVLYRSQVTRTARGAPSPADLLIANFAHGTLPVHDLSIRSRTPEPYRRPGVIEIRRPDSEQWIQVSRVHFEAREDDDGVARATFPEVWARQVRVILERGDAPALPLVDMELSGWARSLVFRASAEHAYRLYYGADEASPPAYPLASEVSAATVAVPEIDLGPRQLNPIYTLPEESPPWLDMPRWALWLVLLFAFVVVGYFLYRVLKS
jgi:hypothetical protein